MLALLAERLLCSCPSDSVALTRGSGAKPLNPLQSAHEVNSDFMFLNLTFLGETIERSHLSERSELWLLGLSLEMTREKHPVASLLLTFAQWQK